mmetsp:Transcript_4404/g.5619  ORF Transcript_4404/g.5619 Transcript_4404/m.5619 type:complete len:613 (+) Transcript_4404:78-1916(+)|eukprot:CAMPEP_0172504326 /NCGR_PEP_ID=MMETSP1066-20121228/177671_1 /TAXON_ID=671091 /ORGANISM="Coscinodiscus wailesii, Strain CCMP2513" /LENGTH=612 /DNA_ID=CAMNT_0013280467 /DNA_START=73 /DNA_END=1911 /DNA_ORIENTATION=+
MTTITTTTTTKLIILLLLHQLSTSTCFVHPPKASKLLSPRLSLSSPKLPDDDGTDNFSSSSPNDDDDDVDPLDKLPSKIGINIGEELRLSPEDASELKNEIKSEIEKTFATRLDELQDMKSTLQKEFEGQKKAQMQASDRRAKEATRDLMDKIDRVSGAFLEETKEWREGTKMAAAADASMVGKGLELGSWGEDEYGKQVVTSALPAEVTSPFLAGSTSIADEATPVVAPAREKKVLFIADSADSNSVVLKQLSDELNEEGITTNFHLPTRPAPMGGLNSQTVVVLASSLTDRAALETVLDRLTSRTAPKPGELSLPPSHIILLSSIGTTRTDKLPYSMTNFMSGGALKKRAEMEEAVISKVKKRSERQMDYTVIKIGDTSSKTKPDSAPLQISPGDDMDGSTSPLLASQILFQTLAYQKPARNVTFSAVGGTAPASQEAWNDLFLRLDGPELLRVDLPFDPTPETYDLLNEYVREWAIVTYGGVSGRKTGLTTPVEVERSYPPKNGMRVLFKETNTGKRYLSKEEEKKLEDERAKRNTGGKIYNVAKRTREGGVEILVEVSYEGTLRVRARRCAMGDDTVVKEISEQTILKRLEEGLQFWIREQQKEKQMS